MYGIVRVLVSGFLEAVYDQASLCSEVFPRPPCPRLVAFPSLLLPFLCSRLFSLLDLLPLVAKEERGRSVPCQGFEKEEDDGDSVFRKGGIMMPVWEIAVIALIPVYAFFLFLVLLPFVSWIQREAYVGMCVRTKRFVSSPSFGLVTYICGNIGVGKTTCGSGICNMLSLIKQEQAASKCEEIRNIFHSLDFSHIDSLILVAFRDEHVLNTNTILSYLLDHDSSVAAAVQGGYYDTHLYPSSKVSLFRDYIEARLAIFRNDYVYFLNRGFFCWPTSTWAMDYDPSMIDVKDRHLDRDYSMLRYSVVFEDEKVLSGKVSTSFAKVAGEDGGGDTFFRLIRHLGRLTLHYISTSQDFGRVVKSERELATGIYYIRKRRELNSVSFRSLGAQFLLDLVRRWQTCVLDLASCLSSYLSSRYYRLLNCFPDSPKFSEWKDSYVRYSSDPSLRSSRFRKVIAHLDDVVAREFADGFVSYTGTYYTSAGDVGRARDQAVGQVFDLDFVFPLVWCYGSVDTYAFSIVHDYLVNESESAVYDGICFSDSRIPVLSDDGFLRFVEGVVAKNDQKLGRRRRTHGREPWMYQPVT